jgi:hypothetical protein
MNHAKIAAALHALADAFLADVEVVEGAVTGKKGGKKAAEQPAATPAAASAPAAPATAAAAPAPASPPAPTVALADVNKLVLKVAAKNRDGAVAILNRFKLANTVGLAPELWQPVYDAFEEEIAKIDAAAVQVQQASLV